LIVNSFQLPVFSFLKDYKRQKEGLVKEYTELVVWQKSRNLAVLIYEMTKTFPKEELYDIVQQLRRAGVSVPSNIAEGCGRRTSADTIRFLHIARGSLYELEPQLYLAKDLKYISENSFDNVRAHLTECKKLLNGFINYYSSK